MEAFRYFLALVLIYILPVVITFWVVIHSGSDLWRKTRPVVAYSVAGAFIALICSLVFAHQDAVLGNDLGFSLLLFLPGLIIYLASWFLWRPVKRYLDFKTFAGVPEVTDEKIDIITDGPFAMVRHPRYLMVWIGVLGWCLMTNYSGVYLVGLASVFGLFLIVRLEERDLVKRFGPSYEDYKREVPCLVPTMAGFRRFLDENFRTRRTS